jgi:hypothetical protein
MRRAFAGGRNRKAPGTPVAATRGFIVRLVVFVGGPNRSYTAVDVSVATNWPAVL